MRTFEEIMDDMLKLSEEAKAVIEADEQNKLSLLLIMTEDRSDEVVKLSVLQGEQVTVGKALADSETFKHALNATMPIQMKRLMDSLKSNEGDSND